MAERTAIEVTVDEAGAVTVHLHELNEKVRRAALAAVARALGASEGSPSERAPEGALADDEWRRAWDTELAARIARADAGTASWISLEDARERLRAAAQRGR